MPNIEIPIVDKDIVKKIIEHKKYNRIIIDYYSKLSNDSDFIKGFLNVLNSSDKKKYKNIDDYKGTLSNRTFNMSKCNSFWFLDKYDQIKEKHLINQNLCRDKFCSNCKKATQAARMFKYNDELKHYDGSLYHLTLTLPSVAGDHLKDTIKHMATCFKYLIQYLRGDRKTKGIDFSSFGYEGALRSLEVTINNEKENPYHPHYHVALVLDPNVLSKKYIENTYSYNFKNGYPELRNLFSKEEILIQKVWYLLINKIRVNKKNIDELDLGYSCKMDKFKEGDYAELFKYLTKEVDEAGKVFTYENFKHLYKGLYRVKQIQGYGVLYRIKDVIDLEEFNSLYEDYLNSLNEIEKPSSVVETPEDLLLDTQYKLISRKSYFKYLREVISS